MKYGLAEASDTTARAMLLPVSVRRSGRKVASHALVQRLQLHRQYTLHASTRSERAESNEVRVGDASPVQGGAAAEARRQMFCAHKVPRWERSCAQRAKICSTAQRMGAVL